MKSTLVNISLLTLMGSASISAAFAEAPQCPLHVKYDASAVGQLPADEGGGWATQTFFEDDNWVAMQTNMYDSDVQSDAAALKRAEEIQSSVVSAPSEVKYYYNSNRTGDYFYVCRYPIGHQYVGIGDSITLLSRDYTDSANQLSVKAVKVAKANTQRSVADKLKRVVR